MYISHISFEKNCKTGFHPSNRRSLLSELNPLGEKGRGENSKSVFARSYTPQLFLWWLFRVHGTPLLLGPPILQLLSIDTTRLWPFPLSIQYLRHSLCDELFMIDFTLQFHQTSNVFANSISPHIGYSVHIVILLWTLSTMWYCIY